MSSESTSPPPLVALMSSETTQKQAILRGFKSIAHFFYPFSTHNCQVREPTDNSPISHQVRLDIRDISNDGHLLSLSVMPFVLTEALKSSANVLDSIVMFRKVLSRWAEPSEHESFGAYLSCIFVVSSVEENPMGEMSKMIQTQQTLYNSTSTLMIPPFCCSPKWATAHAKTPKHYVLLHDSTSPNSSTVRRDEIFAQLCATYGSDNCQILQLDSSTESSELARAWDDIDEMNDVLGRGLDEAIKSTTETKPRTDLDGNSLISTPTSPSSVSTISAILPSVGSVSPNTHQSNSTVVWKNSKKICSVQDSENARNVIGKFLTACLTPFVEKEMRILHEAVGQKKGIGKSISTGMRKWFGTGSSSSNLAVPASYSWDSPEMQVRRLADLFLMFGSPGSAYDQYLPLKRDFEADKAMVAHAMALEMCCVALHSAQPHLNSKQFPLRYLETPLGNHLDLSQRYTSVLRCAFNIADIYADLGCHKEAAATLSRVMFVERDHFVAVAQTLAAEQFTKAGMHRKASFHRVLAANRFSTAGIPALAFDCYTLSLPSFDERHWGVLDEHLAVRLLAEGEKSKLLTGKMAAECVRRLVAVCPKLSAASQIERLRKIVHVLNSYYPHQEEPVNLLVDIPKIEMDSVKVIYGERPLWNEIDENENQSVTSDGWITVERAAHHALFGASAPYRGMQLVSDNHSENTKIRETPANERFRVMVDLTNPLKSPIFLENVKLSIDRVELEENGQNPELGALPQLNLEPGETKTVELYVYPRIGCLKFHVNALLYRIMVDNVGVEARIPLECRGKRLNKTPKQQKSKMYAPDERLTATVAQKPWPLVEFRALKTPHKWSYCDQAQRFQLEIENIGNEDVTSMCLATNAFDRVSAGILTKENEESTEKRTEIPMELAANNRKIAIFNFSDPLKIGEKRRVFIDIRSVCEPTGTSVISQKMEKNTVVLIAYRSQGGQMRQWRRVVDGERRRLIVVAAEILDAESRIFSMHVKNCVAVSQAALSRVEILRIRSTRNSASPKNSEDVTSSKNQKIRVLTKNNRKIEVESEQTDTFVAKMDEILNGENEETWMNSEVVVSPPKWPCPAVDAPDFEEEKEIRISQKIGVLWKANIVNNEGLVTSFIGETFVDDPFARKMAEIKLENNGGASSLEIVCESLSNTSEIIHDFSAHRICEVPVVVKVRNTHPLNLPVDICVKHVAKVREGVDGIHLIPHENRHQMWTNRPCSQRKSLKSGEEWTTVEMKWKVAHPAVYDVGGANLSVEATFLGGNDGEDAEVKVFKVPSVLSVVKSSSSVDTDR